jgi:hypothetical protein
MSPFQAADNPETKKPRLEDLISASTDEADARISSRDTAVSLPVGALLDTDPVKGTRATGRWTPEEDAKLNNAVTNTCKKRYGTEYRTNWIAIAALVPGRVESQCLTRWKDVLNPSIDQSNERRGTWTEDESMKLQDAVQTHGGKNWHKIAALVPGRTISQCRDRWRDALDPSDALDPGVDREHGRTGTWVEDEDSKLKDAV